MGGGLRFCLLDQYAKIQRDIVAAWQGMKEKLNKFRSRSAQIFLILLLRYVGKERYAFHSLHFLLRCNLLYTIKKPSNYITGLGPRPAHLSFLIKILYGGV
jgi:hypothetical protein